MLNTKEAAEPWVGLKEVAAHLNLEYEKVRRMAHSGEIPGFPIPSGKRTIWRFKLSLVDKAWAERIRPALSTGASVHFLHEAS